MDNTNETAEPSGAFGGSVAEAWLVSFGGHTSVMLSGRLAEQRKRNGCEVVPLYRQPTLTDAEREAIEWASLVLRNTAEELDQHGDYPRRLNEAAALMLNLLQRLK